MSTYRILADVYEHLTPPTLLTPEGNVEAFVPFIDGLPENARVLDAACGIGLLAIGLAQRGYRAEATDASPEMIARTRANAAKYGVELRAGVCAWEDLPPGPRFDLVFCVGNALAHARERRRALQAMAATLKPGGALILTNRNWERERALGSRTEDTHTWTMPDEWDEPHFVDVRVAGVEERLTFWPFPYETLQLDLEAAGLTLATTSYEPDAERYLVKGVRPL